MKRTRTKNIIKYVTASVISNIVSLLCGLVVPRLILSNFGSEYNGITQSIAQFISYIALMKSGIGGATEAALYKPLAHNDNREVSEILNSTLKYMRKIALLYAIFVFGFAVIYPTFIVKEFGWMFTASLIVIISFSTFAQYYFGFTYECLLNADQRGYIVTYLNTLEVFVDAIISVILIRNNCSIHVVKLGASVVSIISPLFIYIYVKRKYDLIEDAKSDEDKIPQKWNAAIHEVAAFINNNSDIVILTLFANLKEVSVYTVYHYVVTSIKKIVTNFTVGFGNAFGDMYAKDEIDLMRKNLGIYEVIIYSLTTLFCAVSLVMILPFVSIYTKGVTDINYQRPLFAVIIIFACAFNCYRVPYRSIVYNVGHFKETKNGALFEAVLNVTISVLGVIKFGVIGVAIGSLCAMTFRTFQYAIYLSKNIIDRKISYFIKHILISSVIMIIVVLMSKLYVIDNINTWLVWIMYAIITSLITVALIVISDFIFFKQDTFSLLNKLKRTLLKK